MTCQISHDLPLAGAATPAAGDALPLPRRLDEPTAALDLRHQESVLRHARQLRDEGACVVVVLHDLNLASAFSDRVVLLHEGNIVADGAPDEVFTTDKIASVYRQNVLVTPHPTRNCPMVVTVD